MAKPETPVRRLRSTTTYYLDLQEHESLPLGGLPTNKNVLEVILFFKAEKKNTSVDKLVSCPLSYQDFVPKCSNPGGCLQNSEGNARCVVSQIIERYSQACIPNLRPDKIKTSCVALFKLYWEDIRKHRDRKNPGQSVIDKRQAFKEKLGSLFKAYPDKVEDEIKSDSKRTEQDIKEDLSFFADQQQDWPLRKMGFNTLDRRYKQAVVAAEEREARKRQREATFQARREREAERRKRSLIRVLSADLDSIVGESNNNNSNNNNPDKKDEEWKKYTPTKKKKGGKKTGQTVFIPPNLLALTVPLATICNLSTGQHATMVSGILSKLGCDLDKFTVSYASAARLRLLVNSKVAKNIKLNYTKEVRSKGARIIIHYDGKLMEILLRFLVKRKKNDRVGILAKSPDLPEDAREQLLGIPELASGTGKLMFLISCLPFTIFPGLAQKNAIVELLEYFGITGHVIGMAQDTTAANVAREKGTFARLCKELDRPLLRVDCRRHVTELEVKHYSVPVSGRNTSAPGDLLFKQYREKFDSIRQEVNYKELVTFQWPEEGTFIHRKASEVLALIRKLLDQNQFKRGDYLELTKLVFIFLTGETKINGKEFRLAKPHCVSHARFMQRGLYYLTLYLLGPQADYMNYSEEEQREVDIMAEYTALFYTSRFLQSSLPAEAPILDLHNIRDLRELRDQAKEEFNKDPENRTKEIKVEAVKSNLKNVYLHLDYITEANIVFALAGNMMDDADKKVIATAIWDQLQKVGGNVEKFPFHPDYLKKLNISCLWPEEVAWPDLSKFVGQYSLLLFYHLDMADNESLSWLTKEPQEWDKEVEFCIFQDFVKNIDVTNDCAERQVTKHLNIFVSN